MKTRLIKIVYRRMQQNMLSFTKDISKITRMIGGPKKIYKKNSSKTQYIVSNTITHSIRSWWITYSLSANLKFQKMVNHSFSLIERWPLYRDTILNKLQMILLKKIKLEGKLLWKVKNLKPKTKQKNFLTFSLVQHVNLMILRVW